MIDCFYCGQSKPKAVQDRVHRSNGGIRSDRNRKDNVCQNCQDIMDRKVISNSEIMASQKQVLQDTNIIVGVRELRVENYAVPMQVLSSEYIMLGSEIHSANGRLEGMPHYQTKGYPVFIRLADGAPSGKDRIEVSNTGTNEGVVYIAAVVDPPATEEIEKDKPSEQADDAKTDPMETQQNDEQENK